MAFEISMEGSLEKEQEREAFTAFLREQCEQSRLKLEDFDTSVRIEVCPYGDIVCDYAKNFISITAHSAVGGPGFHAFVCEFFDLLVQESPIPLQVQDETMYYEQRNFEDLKYRHFYPYIMDMFDDVETRYTTTNKICIAWDETFYIPAMKENAVVTPLGYIAMQMIQNRDIDVLAAKCFVWNSAHRDASYYRSCALALAWRDSFGAYANMNEETMKSANAILDYLEAAYDMDDQIALPMQLYETLCHAIHRKILIHHANVWNEDPVVGYRSQPVYYPLGNWCIVCDGCSERSFDASTQTLHFMAPYKEADEAWRWMIKANAYAFDKEVPAFLEHLENPAADVSDAFRIDTDTLQMRGIVTREADYMQIITQVNADTDTLFLEAVVHDQKDVALLVKWMKQVTHIIRKHHKKGIIHHA